jgi:hypothetical protein
MPRRSPRILSLQKAKAKAKAKAKKQIRYLPRRSQRIKDQKKKGFTSFTSYVPTVLNNLPMDIISHHIFPYLDYESRINMNLCLPPRERVRTKMNPHAIKKHETLRCVATMQSILISLEARDSYTHQWVYHGDKRIRRILQMFNLFLKDEYFFLYTHFPEFRAVFIEKITEIQDMGITHGALYSRIWLDELLSTCNSLRNKFLINEVNINNSYKFSAIPSLKFI